MNRTRAARLLLPPSSALLAFASQACSAPVVADGEVAGPEGADAPAAAAPELGGESGEATATGVEGFARASSEGTLLSTGATDVVARLVIPGTKHSYEVLAYELGIESPVTLSSASGGAGSGKADLGPVRLVVRPKAGETLLRPSVFGAAQPIATALLTRVTETGKVAEIAAFGTVLVSSVRTIAAGEPVDEIELEVGSLRVSHGAASVSFDRVQNTATCTEPCPCGPVVAGNLGPYVQTQSDSWPIAPGAIRLSSLSVAVHNEVDLSASTGTAEISKPVLDGIDLEGDMETSGVCAFYYAALGGWASKVSLSVASPLSTKWGPRDEITWDACMSAVSSVTFSSSQLDSSPRERIGLVAAGLVRTDRTFDPLTGKAITTTTSGWSFVKNQPAKSCDTVFSQ